MNLTNALHPDYQANTMNCGLIASRVAKIQEGDNSKYW
jgi:hypothetical protein